jgi:hypothetical protein
MSEIVPVTPVTPAVAQGLLAAADALGLDQSVVTGPFSRAPQGFRVPAEVADKYLEMTTGESLDTNADAVAVANTDAVADPDADADAAPETPEGVYSELKPDEEGYDPAYDESVAYEDLEPSDKAKRTRKINEATADAEAGTQE